MELQMFGIRIKDLKPTRVLSFDVRDILAVIERFATSSYWCCSDLYYTAMSEGQFVRIRAEKVEQQLSSGEFSQFVASIHQTIDGRFEAYEKDAVQPWLIILAIDSSWFEVWSINHEALAKLKEHFQDVGDLSTDTPKLTMLLA
jgi:hypothetical protein